MLDTQREGLRDGVEDLILPTPALMPGMLLRAPTSAAAASATTLTTVLMLLLLLILLLCVVK